MQTLAVYDNDLKELSISLRMIADSLETLSVSDNSITSLKPLYNIWFTQLKWFFLSGNKIHSLDPSALWLPHLRAMHLSDNRICQITDISTVSWVWNATGGSKPDFDLDGNPWHCDASMNWLLQGLHRSEWFWNRFRAKWFCDICRKLVLCNSTGISRAFGCRCSINQTHNKE